MPKAAADFLDLKTSETTNDIKMLNNNHHFLNYIFLYYC